MIRSLTVKSNISTVLVSDSFVNQEEVELRWNRTEKCSVNADSAAASALAALQLQLRHQQVSQEALTSPLTFLVFIKLRRWFGLCPVKTKDQNNGSDHNMFRMFCYWFLFMWLYIYVSYSKKTWKTGIYAKNICRKSSSISRKLINTWLIFLKMCFICRKTFRCMTLILINVFDVRVLCTSRWV